MEALPCFDQNEMLSACSKGRVDSSCLLFLPMSLCKLPILWFEPMPDGSRPLLKGLSLFVARAVPMSHLRDQETDDERVINPEWIVVLAICPHLGCVPISNAG